MLISAVDPTQMEISGGWQTQYLWQKARLNARLVRSRQPPCKFTLLQVDSRSPLKGMLVKIDLTRPLRILYNISTVFIEPFNRTSLESKHDMVSVDPVHFMPAFNRTSLESKQPPLFGSLRAWFFF